MRIRYNSPVILTFALLCSGVFFIELFTGMGLMRLFILQDKVVLTNPISVATLVTHALGHANVEHLMGNLAFILLLGPIVEEKYGSRQMLIMILVTALITGVLNVLLFNTGLLGASGIVFMLIILASFTNTRGKEIPLTFILVALLFLGKEIIQSFKTDQISQFAHIIGGICGSVFGFKQKS
ncbi:MAG TPA: rhomboid family intramembrane serine protease [Saprospiraceae bacterium]|nr:rhomboid family intramembrane serine protease [Saprospiraceae bacterium]